MDSPYFNSCITITWGDSAENHVGMEKIGESRLDIGESITPKFLKKLSKKYPNSELINLSKMKVSCDEGLEKASILILRNFVTNADEIFEELSSLDWDKKAKMRGKVVNKKARWNLCFNERSSSADYENGKGTVVSFQRVPELKKLKEEIEALLEPIAEVSLVAEGNYYYDIDKCYIGYHGDREREFVIGSRFGEDFNLSFQWYLHSEAISKEKVITLHSGDVYIMSRKATGKDWLKRSIPTLRHSASK